MWDRLDGVQMRDGIHGFDDNKWVLAGGCITNAGTQVGTVEQGTHTGGYGSAWLRCHKQAVLSHPCASC